MVGFPPSIAAIAATAEFVVPRSMPTTFSQVTSSAGTPSRRPPLLARNEALSKEAGQRLPRKREFEEDHAVDLLAEGHGKAEPRAWVWVELAAIHPLRRRTGDQELASRNGDRVGANLPGEGRRPRASTRPEREVGHTSNGKNDVPASKFGRFACKNFGTTNHGFAKRNQSDRRFQMPNQYIGNGTSSTKKWGKGGI